ncbi:MAG: hypothetical protein AB8G05_27205 [Oligoflexales bacterium]
MSLVMIKTDNDIDQVSCDYEDSCENLLQPSHVRVAFKMACGKYSVFIKPKHWQRFVGRKYSSVHQIERVVKRYKVFGDLAY